MRALPLVAMSLLANRRYLKAGAQLHTPLADTTRAAGALQHTHSASGLIGTWPSDLEAQARALEPAFLAPSIAVLQASEEKFVTVSQDARRLVHHRYKFLSYAANIEGASLAPSSICASSGCPVQSMNASCHEATDEVKPFGSPATRHSAP